MVILGIDLGLVRTGVAVSDPTGFLASPVGTITETEFAALADKIADIARERGAEKILLGHPRNMDGSCGESAQRSQAFAPLLEEAAGLPVELWDERLTTVSAIQVLNASNTRGKKRKAVVDTVAATILLQEYLDAKR